VYLDDIVAVRKLQTNSNELNINRKMQQTDNYKCTGRDPVAWMERWMPMTRIEISSAP